MTSILPPVGTGTGWPGARSACPRRARPGPVPRNASSGAAAAGAEQRRWRTDGVRWSSDSELLARAGRGRHSCGSSGRQRTGPGSGHSAPAPAPTRRPLSASFSLPRSASSLSSNGPTRTRKTVRPGLLALGHARLRGRASRAWRAAARHPRSAHRHRPARSRVNGSAPVPVDSGGSRAAGRRAGRAGRRGALATRAIGPDAAAPGAAVPALLGGGRRHRRRCRRRARRRGALAGQRRVRVPVLVALELGGILLAVRCGTLLTNGIGTLVTYSATPSASARPISRPTISPIGKPPRCEFHGAQLSCSLDRPLAAMCSGALTPSSAKPVAQHLAGGGQQRQPRARQLRRRRPGSARRRSSCGRPRPGRAGRTPRRAARARRRAPRASRVVGQRAASAPLRSGATSSDRSAADRQVGRPRRRLPRTAGSPSRCAHARTGRRTPGSRRSASARGRRRRRIRCRPCG